jgi:SAM-dependent methyltransferase
VIDSAARRTWSRQYCKLCDRRDFDDEQVLAMIHEIVGPGIEPGRETHRKLWEFAMLGLFLEEAGALREDAEALAIAAGTEEPLFWLANRIGRVLATDIYGEGDFAYREAAATMLSDPAAFAPYAYREDHLEVRSMNALALDLPDESFDIVYSLSSIEHFGGPAEKARAAREMARVLRPGGHLVVVTECLLGRHVLDVPLVNYAIRRISGGRRCPNATPRRRAVDAFTPRELQRDIVAPSGLQLVQPLRLDQSPETFDGVIRWGAGGQLSPELHDARPHIVMKALGAPWTSVFLALHKPAG